MLENSVDELCLNFTYETDYLGTNVVKELIPGGEDILVTDENKKDYLKKFCEMKMTKEIEPQIQAFLKGFRTLLPLSYISHFSYTEFQLLISGLQKIDVEEMKEYCEYSGLTKDSNLANWLWEILGEFNQEEMGAFFFYVSGIIEPGIK